MCICDRCMCVLSVTSSHNTTCREQHKFAVSIFPFLPALSLPLSVYFPLIVSFHFFVFEIVLRSFCSIKSLFFVLFYISIIIVCLLGKCCMVVAFQHDMHMTLPLNNNKSLLNNDRKGRRPTESERDAMIMTMMKNAVKMQSILAHTETKRTSCNESTPKSEEGMKTTSFRSLDHAENHRLIAYACTFDPTAHIDTSPDE